MTSEGGARHRPRTPPNGFEPLAQSGTAVGTLPKKGFGLNRCVFLKEIPDAIFY